MRDVGSARRKNNREGPPPTTRYTFFLVLISAVPLLPSEGKVPSHTTNMTHWNTSLIGADSHDHLPHGAPPPTPSLPG